MISMDVARQNMINSQLKPSEVNDPRLLSVFGEIPREAFVPKAKRGIAYIDEDIQITPVRYLMEPLTFARLLVAANIKQTDLVLDIGALTGYSTAILARLCNAVVGLEEDPKLAEKAEANLAALEIMNAPVVTGNLNAGKASEGPYDVIFIEGAVDDVPQAVLEQLQSEGGRLYTVLNDQGQGRAHEVIRQGDIFARRNLFDANVYALPGFQKARGFEF